MNTACLRSLCVKERLGEFSVGIPSKQFKGYYMEYRDQNYWDIYFQCGNIKRTVASKISTEDKAYRSILDCLRIQQHVITYFNIIHERITLK